MKELKREKVAIENTWATEDIFPSEIEWEKAIHNILEYSKDLKKFKGKLNNAKNLKEYLQKEEALSRLLNDVSGYASLRSDEDTSNSHCQTLCDKAMSVAVNVSEELSFADVEIMKISEDELSSFYDEEPDLLIYKRLLNQLRRNKDHILSEEEEIILAAAQEMANAPTMIHNMLTNADMTFEEAVDKDGKKYSLSNGSFISLMQAKDRILRESAFTQFYKKYGSLKNTSATILASQMKKLKFYANARKFPSTLAASLHATNVPEKVYHNLIDAVHQDIGILHKYMKLRKKLMGVDELHMYDLYVPIIENIDVKVTIDEAKENVLKSVSVLGEDYQATMQHAFDHRWLDVYENKGKRSGAYSSGMNVHPFVLLNYTNTLDSEFTLAHEMGHAMHSYLSTKYQPYVDRRYVIFVAEVASTCNEALLMNYLRNNTNDKRVKAYLINHFLEQFRTTLYRQCMFAEFELKVNELIQNKQSLTADVLSKIYHDLNVYYYGNDVIIDSEIDIEWARIPHFYMNYYVYQYATGFSAAMALSKKIINGEEEAVDKYLTFLKGGCSKSPIELLRGAGVDMESSQPIHDALQLFDSLIDELNDLLTELSI